MEISKLWEKCPDPVPGPIYQTMVTAAHSEKEEGFTQETNLETRLQAEWDFLFEI